MDAVTDPVQGGRINALVYRRFIPGYHHRRNGNSTLQRIQDGRYAQGIHEEDS